MLAKSEVTQEELLKKPSFSLETVQICHILDFFHNLKIHGSFEVGVCDPPRGFPYISAGKFIIVFCYLWVVYDGQSVWMGEYRKTQGKKVKRYTNKPIWELVNNIIKNIKIYIEIENEKKMKL